MSIKLTKVREAIYSNPNLIPVLLRDTSIPKGMIYRELKKVVPCRIGIEFEMSGDFTGGFCEKYHTDKCKNKDLTKFYNVKEILYDGTYYQQEEVRVTSEDINEDILVNPRPCLPLDVVDYDKIVEIRISIIDFHQLRGLYQFMQDLSEFCRLHEGGGIHIHVDMSDFFKGENNKMTEVSKYIERHLNEVIAIFPKYTGHFNKRRVGIRRKSTYVNISRLNTFEFRIAPLTFDYFTLITWIRDCVKFRNKVICECRLKALDKKKQEKELVLYDLENTCCTPNRVWSISNRAATDTNLTGTNSYMDDDASQYIVRNVSYRTAASNEVWS